MKAVLGRLVVSLIPGLIVSVGIVTWSYVLTGGWPPEYILISASIGGMLSPFCWELARIVRGRPNPDTDPGPSKDR